MKPIGEDDEDDNNLVEEANEPPIYAEVDKVEFKAGVVIAKSPYTKIFDVSIVFVTRYRKKLISSRYSHPKDLNARWRVES